MLYLPILVSIFWCEIWHQNMQNGGEVQGGKTPGMDKHTAGEEIVPKLDVGCEYGS